MYIYQRCSISPFDKPVAWAITSHDTPSCFEFTGTPNAFFFATLFEPFLKTSLTTFILGGRDGTVPVTKILQTAPVLAQLRTGELCDFSSLEKTVEHPVLKGAGTLEQRG